MPDAHIAWAVEDRAAGLLADRTDLDAIHVFPRRRLSKTARHPRQAAQALRAFAGSLRADGFDLVLDLQGNLKSGAIARLAKADCRFGLPVGQAREGNAIFLRRHAGATPLRHRVERNLALVSDALGMPLPYVPPGFPRNDAVKAQADHLLRDAGVTGGFVLLHPGTSGFGAFKRWPVDRFAALGRRLAADGARIVVTGSVAEAPLTRAVCDGINSDAASLTPPSLPVLADVIARAALFVAADTGPLHLAALVETPVVGLYGPKDPSVYGPYGRARDGRIGVLDVVTVDDVGCRPCTLRRCAAPLCMTTMDVDMVFDRARQLIGSGA